MVRSRRLSIVVGIVVAVFAVTAIWLLIDNPTVDGTTRADHTCTAPYDTVLNDPDNVPGGEPPPDADEVEARCIEAGETRFAQGLVAGGAAVVLAALAVPMRVRTRTTAPS